MYHAIAEPAVPAEARYACPPRRFEAQIRWLAARRFRFVALGRLVEELAAGAVAPRTVAVTLDDGLRDAYETAWPILDRWGVPFTAFPVLGELGGRSLWVAARGWPPRRRLDREQIVEMHRGGVGFGSHTVTHPRLTALDDAAVRAELAGSKGALEQILGETVDGLAYPYGSVDARVVALAREAGYRWACTARCGFNRAGDDPWSLRRIDVFGTDTPRRLARKIEFGLNVVDGLTPLRYYWRRLRQRAARREGDETRIG